MGAKTTNIVFFLIVKIVFIFRQAGCLLDLDELRSINYGIDILNTPVVLGEDTPAGAIHLTSKFGQQYQCSYLDPATEDKKTQEEEKVAVETGIPELLRPMETGPCLIHTKGWWSYEFCYGKYIKQYHMEEGKISGAVLYLGYYESEFDWNNTTEKSNRNRLNRYHSQQYVNGSLCDLTGDPRRSEIRFMCEEGQGDYISRIDESETCVYIITVHTTKICHHPYLKPSVPTKPVPITCNPLLTLTQYEEYLQEIEEEKRRKEEMRIKAEQAAANAVESEEETNEIDLDQDPGVETAEIDNKGSQKSAGHESDSEKMIDETVNALQKLFMDSLNKGLQDALEEEFEDIDNDMDVDVKLKVLRGPEEIRDYMNKLLTKKKNKEEKPVKMADETSTAAKSEEEEDWLEEDESTSQSESRQKTGVSVKVGDVDAPSDVKGGTALKYESKEEKKKRDDEEEVTVIGQERDKLQTDGDKEILDHFDKELDNIVGDDGDKEHLAKYKENIESAMHAQFGDIIEEAQNELENEGFEGEINKEEAFSKLAATLGKLLKRLERAEEDITNMDQQLENLADKDTSSSEKQEDELEDEDEDWLYDKKQVPAREEQKESPDSKVINTQAKTDTSAEEAKATKESGSKMTTLDDRVRVRVTRVKHVPEEDETQSGDASSSGQKSVHLPPEQKKKLENSVKTELEKAGMDTEGRKVEVKIITAGYYDSDDDSIHILSDEDSNAFSKMIVTILGGGQEAAREVERQQRLEDNYGFVWGKDKKTKQSFTEDAADNY